MQNLSTVPTNDTLSNEQRDLLALATQYAADTFDTFPPAFSQQRLWFLDQLDPGNYAYNMPAGIRMQGPLDQEALRRSLHELIRRHESLRTVFPAVDGQPLQVIRSTPHLALEYVDLRTLPAGERENSAQQRLLAAAQRPFNLTQGPLFHALLLQLHNDEHMLLLVMHHIIADGWSLGVLVRELAALYAVFTAGQTVSLPALPIQYADYAVAHRTWLEGEEMQQQLDYWRQQLSGTLPTLELPADRPRPPVPSYRGNRHYLTLPTALSGQLHELGRREQVTLFMTLLAAFKVLLFRYSGQDDLLVGAPIANRSPETERLIGFFVNTLVLRSRLAGNPSFRRLLQQIRQVTLEAYAHQDLPFEKLVEELQPVRNGSHSPLFQVMFALQNAPMPALRLGDLTLTLLDIDTHTAKFELLLDLRETAEGLQGYFEYSSDRFDAVTIERMAGHFQQLLTAIVADPDQPIAWLPMLSAAERQQLLVDWNDTAAPLPASCIHDLFAAQVARTPDAIAVVADDGQLSYAALDRQANQLAHYLQSRGVGPEVRVGLCYERSVALIVAALAVLKAGGAYLPMDPASPAERIATIVDAAAVQLVLAPAHLREQLPTDRVPVLCLATDAPRWADCPQTPPLSQTQPANLAYVIYTSGSTGTPKGVAISHHSLQNLISWHQQAFAIEPADRASLLAGVGFDASVWEIWPYLSAGAALCIGDPSDRLDPERLQAWLCAEAITICFVPTPLAELLIARPWPGCGQLRVMLTGGDHLRHGPRADLPFVLINNYGPTEYTVVTSSGLVPAVEDSAALPSIGRPIINTRIYLLDAQCQPVPVGVPGELHIGGLGLARGYLNRPDLTAERFVPDPFSDVPGARLYRSGDLARWRTTGEIEYLGRIDHQVKIRGYRIELGEIEATLAQHPAVQQGVVLLREDRPSEKQLVAYVVVPPEQHPASDTAALVTELRAFLAARLPDYMLPAAFVVLDTLPLTPNGKVHRQALPAPDLESIHTDQYVAPRNELEQTVAQICAELLGLERVGIYANFFELGGHSLLATRLHARLRAQFGVDLPLRSIFEQPTIAELAQTIQHEQRCKPLQDHSIKPVARDAYRKNRMALSQELSS